MKKEIIFFILNSTASVNLTTNLLRIREITLPLDAFLTTLEKCHNSGLQILNLPIIKKMLSVWSTMEEKASSVSN